jgi:hypothetical protein
MGVPEKSTATFPNAGLAPAMQSRNPVGRESAPGWRLCLLYPVDKAIVVNEDLADIVALQLGDDAPSLSKNA